MIIERLLQLPFVRDDATVGMLSIGDPVKWIIAARDMMIEQLENCIKGVCPAQRCSCPKRKPGSEFRFRKGISMG